MGLPSKFHVAATCHTRARAQTKAGPGPGPKLQEFWVSPWVHELEATLWACLWSDHSLGRDNRPVWFGSFGYGYRIGASKFTFR